MTQRHLAIAARKGHVKHIPVWHPNGRGAASLCRHWNAPVAIRDGVWLLGDYQGRLDGKPAPVIMDYADAIDRPWCSHCRREVDEMVAALATHPVTITWREP